MLGRTLLHYEILEKLGEGGMGSVWKARDKRLNRLVAIKVLLPDKIADAGRKQRFVQEAQAASALNHPNIVVIHDITSADGVEFIVMEYVAGVTLDRRTPRHGMPLGELLDFAIQITDALAKAHSARIVHRDLKPGNILVTGEGRVKLLDFGLAKLVEPEVIAEDDVTRTVKPPTGEGVILGTIAYMSPEQAEAKPVDARSDIFSFGAVLYEMATGTRAFHGSSKLSTLSAILHENPKPPGEIARDLPRDLEKIIVRCLRKDPSRRFQDAADLKVALAELKEEEAPAAYQSGCGSFVHGGGGRHRLVSGTPGVQAAPSAESSAAHFVSGHRAASQLLPRRHAGGILLERGEAGQLRRLRETSGRRHTASSHNRSCRGWPSALVAGRSLDWVRSQRHGLSDLAYWRARAQGSGWCQVVQLDAGQQIAGHRPCTDCGRVGGHFFNRHRHR